MNVGEFGESSQKCSVNVGESGECLPNCLVNIGASAHDKIGHFMNEKHILYVLNGLAYTF